MTYFDISTLPGGQFWQEMTHVVSGWTGSERWKPDQKLLYESFDLGTYKSVNSVKILLSLNILTQCKNSKGK